MGPKGKQEELEENPPGIIPIRPLPVDWLALLPILYYYSCSVQNREEG